MASLGLPPTPRETARVWRALGVVFLVQFALSTVYLYVSWMHLRKFERETDELVRKNEERRRQLEPPTTKACPDCAETVQAAARKCRFCGYRFAVEEGAPNPASESSSVR